MAYRKIRNQKAATNHRYEQSEMSWKASYVLAALPKCLYNSASLLAVFTSANFPARILQKGEQPSHDSVSRYPNHTVPDIMIFGGRRSKSGMFGIHVAN